MRILLFLSIISLCFFVTFSLEDIYHDLFEKQWNLFKVKYGKTYKGSVEESYRSKIFLSNLKNILNHNQRYEYGEETFKMGINEFTDMFDFEIEKIMCGINGSSLINEIKIDRFNESSVYIPPANVDLPDEVNWIEKGAVTEVKNQGKCGSCWAFSSTGSLEGQVFRLNGKLISLSEQNLMDCSRSYGNHGCGGGLMNRAFRYVRDNNGIDTEESYPYLGIDMYTCKYKESEKGASCRGYTTLKPYDEKILQIAVANVGPISVAIEATSKFMFYSEGIFYDGSCSKSTDSINHAVLIVGYGTDKTTGVNYWLVKNSWGKTWGQKGYIKMARNKNNNCNIASFGIYPVL